MFHHKVVLFQCKWYNTGTSGRRRTIRTNAHCTSIDVETKVVPEGRTSRDANQNEEHDIPNVDLDMDYDM